MRDKDKRWRQNRQGTFNTQHVSASEIKRQSAKSRSACMSQTHTESEKGYKHAFFM